MHAKPSISPAAPADLPTGASPDRSRSASLDHGYGAFSDDGREYVIRDHRTPRPWVNIIATPRVGLAVSQTGGGFTWIDNSQLAVITRWEQDLARDASGKFLFLRDLDSQETWSLTPAPMWPAFDRFACRHGLGYTCFETEIYGIAAEWTLGCHPDATAELWRVRLRNRSGRPRRLQWCSFLEWCCGVAPSPRREFHRLFIETAFDPQRSAVIARNHMWEVPNATAGHWNTTFPYVCAFAATETATAAQGDKATFWGRHHDGRLPAALAQQEWVPHFGRHDDPVAVMRGELELKAADDASHDLGFVLAISETDDEVRSLVGDLTAVACIDQALAESTRQWHERLAAHRIETPDVSVNYLTNDWLRYQAISGRMWGRCGYYQQSGAFGFRDQLQDAQVWLTIDTQKCRDQIRLHAEHQFANGAVYHWWHPLSEQGLPTQMTDDLLWLAFVTANYLRETGDFALLDEVSPFVDDAAPVPLLEHIERAFRRVFERTSPRGLPYIGAGDWNDGLSACGLQEKGESIWLGQFLAGLLCDWAAVYERLGRAEAARDFSARRAALVEALNTHGWDGAWYLRATLDDGRTLGSAANRHGRIFLNPQTWAILNDVADASRQAQCLTAIREHLVSDVGALLLAPAYEQADPAIGYITRYAPGMRENGGVYTHAATWAIAAACKMRDRQLASHLLDAINPALKDPQRYWAEPYVTPGNVDGPQSPYVGRGGWSWYTGSAAWLHRVINEWVLGVRPEWDGLRIDPCLPPGWNRVRINRPYRNASLTIEIEQRTDPQSADNFSANRQSTGGQSTDSPWRLELDGAPIEGTLIPAPRLNRTKHFIRATS